MVVSCEDVWREISNYLEGDIDPTLREALEKHVHGCKRCTAVLDGTRNVVQLYGDERMFEVPLGFAQRLHRKLENNMPRPKGTAFGWMVALAAAALILISFEVGSSSIFRKPQLKSAHAQPAAEPIPPNMMVLVVGDGKTFHVAGCKFIHDKQVRSLTAGEAMREGYVPCIRCMRKYVSVGLLQPDRDDAVMGATGLQ